MTRVNSQSEHSIRPLSSTEEDASAIARPGEPSQPVAADGKAAEIEEEVDEGIAARDPKVARRPARPTKALLLEDGIHHADYRDWCDHCRAGKGVSHQHRASGNDNSDAEFSIDYAFMTKEGQFELERNLNGQDKIGAAPVLMGCDHRSKAIWAMAVDLKGPTQSAVNRLINKLDQAGYRGIKIVLKSGQEESIIALQKAVAIKGQSPTVNIESPVRDSHANGNAERAVRTWAAQLGYEAPP